MSTEENDWGASGLRSKVKPTEINRDSELKTTMGVINMKAAEPAGKDNPADRGPGQRVGRAETKFTKRVPTP